MRLNLALRLEDDPTNSVWKRSVERPYLGTPGVGDWLYLDDEGTTAKPVKRVTWGNDGEITIGFGTITEASDTIFAFGFVRDA